MQLEKDKNACFMRLTLVDRLNEKNVRSENLESMQMDKVTTHGRYARPHHLPGNSGYEGGTRKEVRIGWMIGLMSG